MFKQIELISQMPVRAGKTTAICKAAKEINATVLVHSVGEARRVEKEHDVKAKSINEELRGSRGPYLVDTHAVSFMAIEFNKRIRDLQILLSDTQQDAAFWRQEAIEMKKALETSVNEAERLWKMIDDVSTAGDIFKPEQNNYYWGIENAIKGYMSTIKSDGYELSWSSRQALQLHESRMKERGEK